MRQLAAMNTMMVVLASSPAWTDQPDLLAERKELHQRRLEETKFCFPNTHPEFLVSMSRYQGDCKLHVVLEPRHLSGLTFKIERGGKDLLTLYGHKESSFRVHKNILYFAAYLQSRPGGKVLAFDLTTGKKLWETGFDTLEVPKYSAYENRVVLDVMAHGREGEGVVRITGRESYGDYITIIDQATGTRLASKVYREGF